MALSREDLEQVGVYVRSHLNEWLPREVFDLQERIIRVEDELKAQRGVMVTRFDAVDQRFEDMNRRFEAQQAVMDRHFRFHQWTVTGGVLLLTTLMTLYRFLG